MTKYIVKRRKNKRNESNIDCDLLIEQYNNPLYDFKDLK